MKKKHNIKEIALKFFIPACAVILWQPGASFALENNNTLHIESNTTYKSKNSGLRDTELMLLDKIYQMRMQEAQGKDALRTAKVMRHQTTDINTHQKIEIDKTYKRKA